MKEGFILLKTPVKIALALKNERIDLLLDDEYFEQYQQLAFGKINNNSKNNNNDSNKYVFDFESNCVIERDYQLDDKEEFGSSNSSDIDPTESKPPTFSSFDQFFAFPPQNQVEQKQQLQANQNRQPPVKRALRLSQIGDLLQLEPVNYNDNPFQRQSSGNSTEDQSPINDQFNQSNNNFCNSQFREQQQSILSPNSSMMRGMNLFNYNQTLNMTSPKALSTEHFNQILPINQGNIQHSMQYIVGQIEGKQASYYLEREQQTKLKETQNKKINDVFGQMFQMQLSKQ
ncbi:UNKNOWN [Stylonychia lemnae]|uniref:Uncharacterized protein n=1 Tax=Stylonychia lemnae TaxID=5949 RepID=A0A077ZXF9_STYLE|nr:UNKNOWN [Stylonychia lemnae]|eukprot:CDW74590.1 UNKNOWN [Stylonychia lemnae]